MQVCIDVGKNFICSVMSKLHWSTMHINSSPLYFYWQTIAWKFSDHGRYFLGGRDLFQDVRLPTVPHMLAPRLFCFVIYNLKECATFCVDLCAFQIFEQLKNPLLQHGFFNVLSYMLLSIQHSPVVFHKVFAIKCTSLVCHMTSLAVFIFSLKLPK